MLLILETGQGRNSVFRLANLNNLGKDFKVFWRKITALKINLRLHICNWFIMTSVTAEFSV